MTMYEACLMHSRADRALRLVVANALEEFNITMMQWLLLATVQKGPATGMRMKELAEALDVTMPQITALMNDLTKMKLAKQKINSSDRRSRRLSTTPLGKQHLQKIDKTINSVLKDWLEEVPTQDMNSYLATVKRLASVA